MNRERMWHVATLGLCWVGMVGIPAEAGLTTVHAPPGGEASHIDIFNHLYGAGFADLGAGSFTNGTVDATRVDDFLPSQEWMPGPGTPGDPLPLVTGMAGSSATDQVWTDGIAHATAEAKYAAYSQQFGFDVGSGYVNLFDVKVDGPSGFDISGSSSVTFEPGVEWEWARSGFGGKFYSAEASNVDGLDHMVTYQITSPFFDSDEAVWLSMWEDLTGPFGGIGDSDRDFNDLVVELRAEVVPLPGALLLGVAGLGLVDLLRRRLS